MVTYKLLLKDEKSMQYAYWPEGHEDKQPGIIVVDFEKELVYVKKPAEDVPRLSVHPEHGAAGLPAWQENQRLKVSA